MPSPKTVDDHFQGEDRSAALDAVVFSMRRLISDALTPFAEAVPSTRHSRFRSDAATRILNHVDPPMRPDDPAPAEVAAIPRIGLSLPPFDTPPSSAVLEQRLRESLPASLVAEALIDTRSVPRLSVAFGFDGGFALTVPSLAKLADGLRPLW
jgi:hypothetical protein